MEDFEIKRRKDGTFKVVITSQIRSILIKYCGYGYTFFAYPTREEAETKIRNMKNHIKRNYKGNLILDLR